MCHTKERQHSHHTQRENGTTNGGVAEGAAPIGTIARPLCVWCECWRCLESIKSIESIESVESSDSYRVYRIYTVYRAYRIYRILRIQYFGWPKFTLKKHRFYHKTFFTTGLQKNPF